MKEKQVKRLFDIPVYQKENYKKECSLASKKNGVWSAISSEEYIDKANLFSLALLQFGLKKADKIAIIVSTNCPEWHISDIAIQQMGGIVVPIYSNISKEDYLHIFGESEIKFCIVSDATLLKKVKDIQAQLPLLKEIITFEPADHALSWYHFLEKGKNGDLQVLENIKNTIQEEDLATIIYTSGTTGLPKGVMLSHKNILVNVKSIQNHVPGVKGKDVALSFLPVCHVYERTLLYMYQYMGFSVYFAESLEKISDNAKEIKPHFFSTVPRVIEKVYDKIMLKGNELTGFKKSLFFWAIQVAEEYTVDRKSLFYNLKLAIARKLIFKKWQEALGGRVKALVSGSAALQVRLLRIFYAAGIPILEGYGLTETSPVISVNSLDYLRIGSVGKVIDGVLVKIAEDGEIRTKSDCVMMGYYKSLEKTAEVFDQEGYFCTGDIGKLEDGYLTITDRKKEMFKTSGGKYIAPQVMENIFKQSAFIEQIMIVGEGQKFPAALIVPKFDILKKWAEKQKINYTTPAELITLPAVIQKIEQEVAEVNEHFGQWEKVKKITLIAEVMTTENGLLTPTLKVKRKVITAKYQQEINSMYVN